MKKFASFMAGAVIVAGVGAGGYHLNMNKKQLEVDKVNTSQSSERNNEEKTTLSDDPKETKALDELMSKEEVMGDLKYMMLALKMYHPAWGTDGDQELVSRVDRQYQIEIQHLTENMTVLEAWRACSRIIHEMGDAHTRVSLARNQGEYAYNVPGKIVAINGEPVETISKRFLALWPYELESYGMTRFEKFIVYKEYMELVGIETKNDVEITYLDESGEHTKKVEAGLCKDKSSDYVSCKIDKEHNLGIFTLDSCKANDDHYFRTLKMFFDSVEREGITHIVLDLRENNGGWIPVIKDFMKYINVDRYQYCRNFEVRSGGIWLKENEMVVNDHEKNAYAGKIYVLTSPRTFSAAMDFAMVIKDNGLGEIVGEIPGNMPDCYTYNNKYQLPNSRLKISISNGRQNRIDESKTGEVLEPDHQVEASKALDEVIKLINA